MTAEIRHIEAFLAIARFGNFTRAAAELHVSQPALTVQIRQLEAALGVRLFDRNNRNVALTQIGRALVTPFERVILDIRSIVDSAHDAASHRGGVVTVACLPSIAAGLLPVAIARLRERHQGITVRVRDGVAARVVELLKSGEADFGISSCGRVDRELEERPLFSDRMVAFVREDHRLASHRSVTLRAVAEYPLILTGKDSSVRELLDRTLEQARLPIRISQEASYMTTALGMAAAGLGVAILPDAAIHSAPAGVRRVAIRNPVLQRRIGIITRAGRSLSPAAQRLVEVFTASLPAGGARARQPVLRER
jgi:LysR family transcriptional regulator, carnitine catabolism transcriptional activator